MRYLFCKSNLGGLILAAVAAGTWSLPAVAASQSTQSAAAPSSTSPTAKKPAASTAAKPTTDSGTKKPAVKSTHGKSSSRKRSRRVKGQKAPTPDRINEIQEALASRGAFAGTPTGKWDSSTVEAMKKFQASQGLNPTGKVDALTLQKLGLGSQTAGLAAPTPPPNSVNRLRNAPSALEEPSPPGDPHN